MKNLTKYEIKLAEKQTKNEFDKAMKETNETELGFWDKIYNQTKVFALNILDNTKLNDNLYFFAKKHLDIIEDLEILKERDKKFRRELYRIKHNYFLAEKLITNKQYESFKGDIGVLTEIEKLPLPFKKKEKEVFIVYLKYEDNSIEPFLSNQIKQLENWPANATKISGDRY